MFQLIYTSIAKADTNRADILNIVQQSSEFNAANNITGCLIYHKKEFIQLLEGKKDSVQKLYLKIIKDSRHSHVTLLSEDEVSERLFPDWSMRYYEMGEREFSESDEFLFQNNFSSFANLKAHPTISTKIFCKVALQMLKP